MKKLIRENLFKNAILLIALALSYLPIKNFLFSTELITDKPLAGDLLVAISIIAVTACFGNFVILNVSLIILYLASACYDFWDLARMDLRIL